MAVLRCDACGGDTFEALSEPGFFHCHNCGAAASVKLAVGSASGAVRLRNPGPRKIAVIKVGHDHTGIGLKKAKDLVDASERSPQSIGGADLSALDGLAKDLAAAGAVVQQG